MNLHVVAIGSPRISAEYLSYRAAAAGNEFELYVGTVGPLGSSTDEISPADVHHGFERRGASRCQHRTPAVVAVFQRPQDEAITVTVGCAAKQVRGRVHLTRSVRTGASPETDR
jgi:hypothetical protein